MSRRTCEGVVSVDRKVHVPDEGFEPGTKVLVVELESLGRTTQYTPDQLAEAGKLIEEIRRQFPLVRYDNPTEPVGLEDWEMLGDEDEDRR